MPDDELKRKRPGIDASARVLLGRHLRDYYDRMRQTTVSDSLAQLLHRFEIGTAEGDMPLSTSQAGAAPQSPSESRRN